jgi:hypothetical protein
MNFQYVFGNPTPAKKHKKNKAQGVAKAQKPSKIKAVASKKKSAPASKKKVDVKASSKKPVRKKATLKVQAKKPEKKKSVSKVAAKKKTSARVFKEGKGSEVAKKKKAKKKSSPKRRKKASVKKTASKKRRPKAKKAAAKKAAPKRRRKRKVAAKVVTAPKRRRKKARKASSKKRARYTKIGKNRKTRRLPVPRWGKTARVKIKAKRRGKKGFKRIKLRAHKRLYKNPIGGGNMIEQYLGHTNKEALGLVGGGLAYGAVNSLLMKLPVVNKIHAQLVKVPVIGTALPTLVLGALLVKLGQSKKNALLQQAGAGLVGASIVGIGVNASQLIPGLKPSVAGVDYTMQGVDYTMQGVDYTMQGDGQLGEGEESDFGDSDFGAIDTGVPEGLQGFGDAEADFGEADADFGEMPDGLQGDGQLG